ncbi:hypothetical protein DACRYDRAFT_82948 [Dacryopinax primogenitus]|uniref:Ras modification protein ERF4 n=1 Tax=Dacryopinax primogenitus (strain DJM 731) TaxID=1858805 RepID=M5FZP9_DACPD|nr:uncharacterized protein DACRYDRAFT_82948 [Dacryopinax primogenitus]EJT99041.1 hypothetical protein DACRYDRAFT_82948 [Dacryopinax primogenitus]
MSSHPPSPHLGPPSPMLSLTRATTHDNTASNGHSDVEKAPYNLSISEPTVVISEKSSTGLLRHGTTGSVCMDREQRNGNGSRLEAAERGVKGRPSTSAETAPRIPKSSYYIGPPSSTSAYGTPPTGKIGVHYPREILRVERDYSGGEIIQFHPAYPLELEGRITHTQFQETINTINERLISAHSLWWSFFDNTIAILTLYLSWLCFSTHYDREMSKLRGTIDQLNRDVYNPAGLNILWPRSVAFLFLEIEYY